jgi:hypothetical protein
MFVNLETSDFREVLQELGRETWNAVAVGFLERNDRNVAVGKIADAVQFYAAEQPVPGEPMLATLFSCALKRVDFYTLALELVQRVEAANPSLVKDLPLEGELLEDDLLAA